MAQATELTDPIQDALAQTLAPRDERLFPTLDDDDLEQLRPLAKTESYAPGDFVLRHGQSDIDLFVIESGSVQILNPANDDAHVVTHGPRGFIGDIDMLTRRPIIIDAVARGDGHGGPTVLLRVPGAQMRKVLNSVPRLSEKLIVAFATRRQALEKAGVAGVRVVGPPGCNRTNEVREFLHKNFVPFIWDDSDTEEGRRLLGLMPPDDHPKGHDGWPAVDLGDGRVLRGPSLHDVAEAAGVWRGCPDAEVDLVIVGAGPAGLAAAVYAASEGLSTVVLDKLGPGGQAGGSSKIENFIGFPAGLSGNELATRGVLQMLKFGATMVAPVKVLSIDPAKKPGDCHAVALSCGNTIRARCVLATTGVAWRRLEATNAAKYERAGIYYACTRVEAELHDDCDVAVVGGGNSAGQAVMFLAECCRGRTVHLIVRSPLTKGMSEYLISRIEATPNVKVHQGVMVSAVNGGRKIETIELTDCGTGATTPLKCQAVFVFIGAEPHADFLPANVARDEHGYVLTGSEMVQAGKWPLTTRAPCPLETSVPGILAGGDLRAGSTKRVGFAVGDGSLAVTCVHKLRSVTA